MSSIGRILNAIKIKRGLERVGVCKQGPLTDSYEFRKQQNKHKRFQHGKLELKSSSSKLREVGWSWGPITARW